MNALKIVGIALIVIGVTALIFQGITYTTEETVVELGPIEVATKEDKRIPLSPILGVLLIVGGVTALLVGSRKQA